MHDFTSAATTYGLGVFAFFFSQDLTTYAAFAGLLLVLVRIGGDLPKAIQSWKELLQGDDDHDSGDDG